MYSVSACCSMLLSLFFSCTSSSWLLVQKCDGVKTTPSRHLVPLMVQFRLGRVCTATMAVISSPCPRISKPYSKGSLPYSL